MQKNKKIKKNVHNTGAMQKHLIHIKKGTYKI